MIVTIDGPAGAGKSSAARGLARRLGFRFLDTGAMYRAVTLAARERGLDLADPDQMKSLVPTLRVELAGDRVLLDGRDVTDAIRKFDVSASTHYAADNADVRAQLVIWQREAAANGNVVTEGRDQGTVVFPDAQCKIFLTADEGERARRRHADLAARGEVIPYEEVLANQQLRDLRDASRPVGALVKADDAIEVSTDGLTTEEVVAKLERIVRSRQ
jgi:cytidylate kinase